MTQRTGQAAGESLTALLAGGNAEHPALIVPDSGEVLTYGQAARPGRGARPAARRAGRPPRRPGRPGAAQRAGRRAAAARRDRARRRRGPAESRLHRGRVRVLPGRYRPPADADPGQRRRGRHRRGGGHRDRPDRRAADRGRAARTAGRRPGRHAPARVRAGQPGGCRLRAAYERDDEPAQAGPAASAQPHGLDPDDRRALPAQPGGCVVLRDAAVPHSRPGGVHVRGPEHGRRGHRPAPVHAAAVLAAGPRARRHLAVGGPDSAPDDPGQGRRRRPAGRRCGSSDRAAPRWRLRSWNGPSRPTRRRCSRPTE